MQHSKTGINTSELSILGLWPLVLFSVFGIVLIADYYIHELVGIYSVYDLANVVPALAKFYHQASESYEHACTRFITTIIYYVSVLCHCLPPMLFFISCTLPTYSNEVSWGMLTHFLNFREENKRVKMAWYLKDNYPLGNWGTIIVVTDNLWAQGTWIIACISLEECYFSLWGLMLRVLCNYFHVENTFLVG